MLPELIKISLHFHVLCKGLDISGKAGQSKKQTIMNFEYFGKVAGYHLKLHTIATICSQSGTVITFHTNKAAAIVCHNRFAHFYLVSKIQFTYSSALLMRSSFNCDTFSSINLCISLTCSFRNSGPLPSYLSSHSS